MAPVAAAAVAAVVNATANGSHAAPVPVMGHQAGPMDPSPHLSLPSRALVAATGSLLAGHGGQRLPTAEDTVLLLAIAANCALILAPLRPALAAARSGLSPGDRQALWALLTPTYMLFAQSFYWACYGFLTDQPDITHLNTFGAGMCVVYFWVMCKGAHFKEEQVQSGICAAILAAVAGSLLVSALPIPTGSKACIMALLATIFSMLQSASPMHQAMEALRTMTVHSFPLALAASSCVSSILWAQYAIIIEDYVYFLPNGINASVGIFELAIFAWVLRNGARKAGFHLIGEDRPLMPRSSGNKACYSAAAGPWPTYADIKARSSAFAALLLRLRGGAPGAGGECVAGEEPDFEGQAHEDPGAWGPPGLPPHLGHLSVPL